MRTGDLMEQNNKHLSYETTIKIGIKIKNKTLSTSQTQTVEESLDGGKQQQSIQSTAEGTR